MRYLFGFACVVVSLVASPLSVSAQTGGEGTSAEPSADEPVQSRIERWHPEAFVDPTKRASDPALQLGLDSAGLEVTPTGALTVEELERQEKKERKRRMAIGVGVSFAVLALGGLLAGFAVAAGSI